MEKELLFCDNCQEDVYPEVNSYGHGDNMGYEVTCSICGNIIDED